MDHLGTETIHPGWLGGALQWHLAARWLLAGNGLLYLGLNLVTGRFRCTLLLTLLLTYAHESLRLPVLQQRVALKFIADRA